ncbi:hypothetical protein E2C01_005751 [Portunus trituberculatus]|uniref:Uncharacterized protein n=1 Tax=Portunus trituberculatus TaxID=210409 RepID=A0A5B7D003_PORTR|nr:hypothetical protein [Portunus trituberculatus]
MREETREERRGGRDVACLTGRVARLWTSQDAAVINIYPTTSGEKSFATPSSSATKRQPPNKGSLTGRTLQFVDDKVTNMLGTIITTNTMYNEYHLPMKCSIYRRGKQGDGEAAGNLLLHHPRIKMTASETHYHRQGGQGSNTRKHA